MTRPAARAGRRGVSPGCELLLRLEAQDWLPLRHVPGRPGTSGTDTNERPPAEGGVNAVAPLNTESGLPAGVCELERRRERTRPRCPARAWHATKHTASGQAGLRRALGGRELNSRNTCRAARRRGSGCRGGAARPLGVGFRSGLGCPELRTIAPKIGEGNGTPLQYSCLENPMGGGAWWAAVHGVAKNRTRLSDFPFAFHFHALEKEMATHSSVLAWRIPGTGRGSLVGCCLWGHTESDTTEAT